MSISSPVVNNYDSFNAAYLGSYFGILNCLFFHKIFISMSFIGEKIAIFNLLSF